MASPPNRAPVPWVPVASAPATVCRSMSPRLVSDQPRPHELGVQPVQRNARADGDQPVVADLDRPASPPQVSWTSSGRPMPVNEWPLPIGRTRRPAARRLGQDGGDLVGRAGLHDLGRRRARCRPSCASATRFRGSGASGSRSLLRRSRTPSASGTLLLGNVAGQRSWAVDPPPGRPARCAVMSLPAPDAGGRRSPGPAGPRDRRPRPAARRRSTWTPSTPTPTTWSAGPAGKPIRVASKSVRCRALLRRVLARPGFAGRPRLHPAPRRCGWPAATTRSAPTSSSATRRPTGRRCAGWPPTRPRPPRVTLMVDSTDQLDLSTPSSRRSAAPSLRVCLDLDASLRAAGGRVHVGRPPLPRAHAGRRRRRSPRQVAAPAGLPARRADGLRGADRRRAGRTRRAGRCAALAVRGMQARVGPRAGRTAGRGRRRRLGRRAAWSSSTAAAPAASSAPRPRTPSPRSPPGRGCTARCCSTATAPSRPRPAAFFAVPVMRRPGAGHGDRAGGGWIASGPPGADRLPVPTYPAGLSWLPAPRAPARCRPRCAARAPAALRVGDRVWFRHAKAGELCEHVERAAPARRRPAHRRRGRPTAARARPSA